METPADSKLLRHGAVIAVIGLVGLVLAGCLPENQAKGRKGDNLGSAESRSADAANANRRGKIARGQAESGQETSIFTAGTTSYSSEDGEPRIPSIEDIPEVPANVALNRFFAGLMKLEKAKQGDIVTILHIGDSHIAADRFSGSLREQFQSRFGDAGRGLLTPGLYLARGVKFDRGGKWKVALSTGDASGPFGVTGAKLTANTRDAWVRLTAQDQNFAWSEITLDSGPQNGTVLISLDGEIKEASTRDPEGSWRNFRMQRSARELMVRPKGDGPVTIHSISIGTDKPGVRYINLGLPGATALTPLSWDRDYLEADLKRLAPNLIVFSYGTGESFNDQLDLNDYEAKASAAISRMRRAAPKASLLVIGPPDIAQMPKFAARSGRASDVCRALSPAERADYAKRLDAGDPRLARWHPPINLEAVRATLRRLAAAHNALFWDWSKPMGGACGIHAWVHSKPPLAANDHVHLTEEGSKRSARLLFRELMSAYDAVTRTASAKQ
jgi:lysophospholipase L1-like esterase